MVNILESDILKMVRKSVSMLLENAETNNINAAKQFLKANGHESDYSEVIERIRHKIENVRLGKYKFLLGACKYYLDGSLNDGEYVSKFNQILQVITRPEYINNYPREIGVTLNQLISNFSQIINDELEAEKAASSSQTYTKNTDYEIIPIESFDEAAKYGKYTSWCVTHSQYAFEDYTNNGRATFYFCLKKGFENIDRVAGENTPLDEYGLSMIAVCVGPDGSLKTCTCRWNHDNGGNDRIMKVQDLNQLFGCNFYETFKPKTNFREEVSELLRRFNSGKENPSQIFMGAYEYPDGVIKVQHKGLLNFIIDGKYISDRWFDEAGKFVGDNPAWVLLDEVGYNYIRKDGTFIQNDYWFSEADDFVDGLATVDIYTTTTGDNTMNMIKTNGKFFFNKPVFNIMRINNSKIILVQRKRSNPLYLVFKYNGTLLTKTLISQISFNKPINGYQKVQLGAKRDSDGSLAWPSNFLNLNDGTMLFNFNLKKIDDDREGFLYLTNDDGDMNIMTPDLELLSKEWFFYVGKFDMHCDLAIVENEKGYNFMKKNGEFLLDKWCDIVREFSAAHANVVIDGETGIIDYEGNFTPKLWFDNYVSRISPLYKVVSIDGFGYNVYFPDDDRLLSKEWFDEFSTSLNNLPSRVFIAGKGYNFINDSGNFLQKIWFYDADKFKTVSHTIHGAARVRINGKGFNFINENGNLISNIWFDKATEFEHGFATVRIRGKGEYRIDWRGKFHNI